MKYVTPLILEGSFCYLGVKKDGFTNLRMVLQRKIQCRIKKKFCIGLSVLRLLHVAHGGQNIRRVLSLAWHERQKNETTFYTAAGWRCRQNLKNQNFTSSLSRTGTATTKPQINDLIGSMRKNNRAARAARI